MIISPATQRPATWFPEPAACASCAGPCGKRGGARVVYYYHSDAMPIFALTAYAKNERADISQADRNDFRRLTALLVERYARRSR